MLTITVSGSDCARIEDVAQALRMLLGAARGAEIVVAAAKANDDIEAALRPLLQGVAPFDTDECLRLANLADSLANRHRIATYLFDRGFERHAQRLPHERHQRVVWMPRDAPAGKLAAG